MDLASSGDGEAFGVLATELQQAMYRLAMANGLGAADAAEACQEAMLRAYSKLSNWRAGSDATAYLAGITLNVVREIRRRRRRECLGISPDVIEAAISQGPRPSGGIDIRTLAEAMELLPARQREVVSCRFLRRMSVEQTAEAMQCAEGTVKAATFAALANLRKMLDEST